MKTLITIMAHGAQQSVFDQHDPLWRAMGFEIWVVCPENDPVKTDHKMFSVFDAAHDGPPALQRLNWMVEILALQPAERHIIFEYDSFFLKDPGFENGLRGRIFPSYDNTFMTPHYPNPPWVIDSESLNEMARAAKRFKINEDGMSDRYLAALAFLSGVAILPFNPKGCSRAPLTIEHDSEEIRSLTAQGAFAFHGIKDRATLDFILAEYSKAHPDAPLFVPSTSH